MWSCLPASGANGARDQIALARATSTEQAARRTTTGP